MQMSLPIGEGRCLGSPTVIFSFFLPGALLRRSPVIGVERPNGLQHGI